MSKNAASEDLLGSLHNKVATVMVNALNNIDKAQTDWATHEPVEGEQFRDPPDVSPSLLAAMTKFLSDNKITCNPAEVEAVSTLEARLKAKQKRRSVGNIIQMLPED